MLHSRRCLSINMGPILAKGRIPAIDGLGEYRKWQSRKDINTPFHPALHSNSSSTQIQSTKQITKLRFHKQQQLFPTLYLTNRFIYFPNNIQDAFLYYLCYPPPHRRHCPRCSSRPDSQELYVILFPPLYSWNYPANSTQATLRLENARLSALSLLRLLLLFPLQPRLLARMWR